MKIVTQNIHFWSDSSCRFNGEDMITNLVACYSQCSILCIQEVLYNACMNFKKGAHTFYPYDSEEDNQYEITVIFVYCLELQKILKVEVRVPKEEIKKCSSIEEKNLLFMNYLHKHTYLTLGCPKSFASYLIRTGTFSKDEEELYNKTQSCDLQLKDVNMIISMNYKKPDPITPVTDSINEDTITNIWDITELMDDKTTIKTIDFKTEEVKISNRDLFIFASEPEEENLNIFQQEMAILTQRKKQMHQEQVYQLHRAITTKTGVQQFSDINPLIKGRYISLVLKRVWTNIENDLFDGTCLKELAEKAGYKYVIFAGTNNPTFGNAILSKHPFDYQHVIKLQPGFDKTDKLPMHILQKGEKCEEITHWRNAIIIRIAPLIYREPMPVVPFNGAEINYSELIDYKNRRVTTDFYKLDEYTNDQNPDPSKVKKVVVCDTYEQADDNMNIIAVKSANPMRVSRPFWVVNTHLDHLCESRRIRQAKILVENLARLKLIKDAYTILCGDFNSLLQADYSNLQKRMIENDRIRNNIEKPMYEVTKFFLSYFIETLWNSTQTTRMGEIPPTTHYGTRVDYIFVNSLLNGIIGSVKIIDVKESDHKGTVAEIHLELLQK